MEYAKLGNTGMDVSRICLGCMGFGDAERWIHQWVLNEEDSRPIIQKALELGINFFDTANVYSLGERLSSPLSCTAECTTDPMAPVYRARRS